MKRNKTRIYIIGAGFAGSSIAAEIKTKGILGEVVAFLDDDSKKIGSQIDGIPVLGPIDAVVRLLQTTPADEALIAMPGVPRERVSQIYRLLQKAGFSRIRIVPSLADIVDGEAHLIQTREIDPADLLGRNPVRINLKKSLSYLRGKRVLVTGAGGSIGSELSRQLLSGGAERLYLLGHGENSIYGIDKELRILQEEGVGEAATIVPVIGDLQDADYMRFILDRLKADVVFHAAAHKHVPMMESNPVEAIKNNVFGTRNLVEAAKASEVKRFVMISTDKVVEPASVYGASKRIAESLVLSQKSADANSGQAFMVVRFGNVLGSRGSIIPLFTKQILKGGPLTLTDPETSRYFMTIPEAASLVLQAGGVGKHASLYVLDMGEPVRIRDLAEQMIRFYGFEPESDVPFEFIGMRPGEKVHERLYERAEKPVATESPRISKIENHQWLNGKLSSLLDGLADVCYQNRERPREYRNRRRLRELLCNQFPTMELLDVEPES